MKAKPPRITPISALWRHSSWLWVCTSIFTAAFFTPLKASHAQDTSLAIAAYQALGVQSQLSQILESVREAYHARTGAQALPLSAIETGFGNYGLSQLGSCAQKIGCFVQKTTQKIPQAKQGLYLGIGAIGQKLLVRFIHIDIAQGQSLQQINQTFSGLTGLKAGLPEVMRKLFPNYATLELSGSPVGANVTISDQPKGNLPTSGIIVSSGKPLDIVVSAPNYTPWKSRVTLQPNEAKKLVVLLKKVPVGVVIIPKRRRVPVPPPSKPFYQAWWFWTAAGVVVVAGAAVAVGVVVTQQNQQHLSPIFQAPLAGN